MIIGICGYKGSGKSTVTDAVINLRPTNVDFVRMGFADPMYKMMEAVIPRHILYDKSKWDDPLDILCGKTLRYAMVTLGTEWGRDFIGNDFWTNIAISRAHEIIPNSRNVPIIDNVRFPSEAEALLRAGGVIIAFRREGHAPDTSHVSEQHIEEIQNKHCKFSFMNSGCDLKQDAKNFLHVLTTAAFYNA